MGGKCWRGNFLKGIVWGKLLGEGLLRGRGIWPMGGVVEGKNLPSEGEEWVIVQEFHLRATIILE